MQCTDPAPLYYACTARFSNFSKKLKLPLQASLNKRIGLSLQLDKRSNISVKKFLLLHWLKVHDRYLHALSPKILILQ